MVMEQIQNHIEDGTLGRELFRRAHQQAITIVRERVASVRALSQALQERETLTHDDVTSLIVPAPEPGP